MEESGESKPRSDAFFVDILVLFISALVVGLTTFICAMVAEHSTGYTNSCLMLTCYVMLMLSLVDVFSSHRSLFALVCIWQFYRNLSFQYDEWPDSGFQMKRDDLNIMVGIGHLLFSTLLCLQRTRIQTLSILFVLGGLSTFQRNPGNDDEEWIQTLNVCAFCFLYCVAYVVRRLEKGLTDSVTFQCVWALQTNNFVLLGVGMLLQLLIYNYVLFSQSRQENKTK